LLKAKNTVYLFGNHDKEHFMDERIKLFSNFQGLNYELISGNKTFHFQHGHLLSPAYDKYPLIKNNELSRPLFQLIMWILRFFKPIRLMQHDWEYHGAFIRLKKYIEDVEKRFEKNHYYIFSHSHLHKVVPRLNLINLGVFQPKRRHFLLIKDGKIFRIPKKQQHES